MDLRQQQRPGHRLGGEGCGQRLPEGSRQPTQPPAERVRPDDDTEGGGKRKLEADVTDQARFDPEQQGGSQREGDEHMALPVDHAAKDHQPAHQGCAQRRRRRAGEEGVADDGDQCRHRRTPRPHAAERLLHEPGEQGDIQTRRDHDMDEPAGNHLLLEGRWQRRPVTEDDPQEERRLRFG